VDSPPKQVSPKRNLYNNAPELPRARRNPMVMTLDIDYVVFMRILGIIFVLVAVFGGILVAAAIRERNKRREEKMEGASTLRNWDAQNRNSFSHR
jgi:hypothetical protein